MLALARRRAETHPADAIPVYARAVEAAIDRKDRYGYAKAATLLTALRDLHQQAGSDFVAYLDRVKYVHRRKSAPLQELASAHL